MAEKPRFCVEKKRVHHGPQLFRAFANMLSGTHPPLQQPGICNSPSLPPRSFGQGDDKHSTGPIRRSHTFGAKNHCHLARTLQTAMMDHVATLTPRHNNKRTRQIVVRSVQTKTNPVRGPRKGCQSPKPIDGRNGPPGRTE